MSKEQAEREVRRATADFIRLHFDSLERYGLAAVPFVLAGADLLADPEVERTVFVLAGAGLVLASVLAFTGVLVP